jgi:hypothetical protein
LEEAGQEKIVFALEKTSPKVKAEEEPSQKELPIVVLKEDVPDESSGQEPLSQIGEEQKIESASKVKENSIKPVRTSELEIQSGEMSSTTKELNQEDDQNTSGTGMLQTPKGQAQNRWKAWKDKIQGFIKKLFA